MASVPAYNAAQAAETAMAALTLPKQQNAVEGRTELPGTD